MRVGDRDLYLFTIDGRTFAADATCPCPLSGGVLDRLVDGERAVECNARCYTMTFDLETGRNTQGYDGYAIGVYPVRVEAGQVVVAIPDPPSPPRDADKVSSNP